MARASWFIMNPGGQVCAAISRNIFHKMFAAFVWQCMAQIDIWNVLRDVLVMLILYMYNFTCRICECIFYNLPFFLTCTIVVMPAHELLVSLYWSYVFDEVLCAIYRHLGSTDTVSYSTQGLNDATTSALHIIMGILILIITLPFIRMHTC